MRLRTSFETRLDPEAAFAYLSDFGRIEEWDPFIASAERLDPGAPRVGSRYLLRSKGPGLRLHYAVETLDPAARRIRLGGSARGYAGWDEITVVPASGGAEARSRVTYEAEIALTGRARLLWLAAPLLLVGIALSGGRALRGMQRRLDALA